MILHRFVIDGFHHHAGELVDDVLGHAHGCGHAAPGVQVTIAFFGRCCGVRERGVALRAPGRQDLDLPGLGERDGAISACGGHVGITRDQFFGAGVGKGHHLVGPAVFLGNPGGDQRWHGGGGIAANHHGLAAFLGPGGEFLEVGGWNVATCSQHEVVDQHGPHRLVVADLVGRVARNDLRDARARRPGANGVAIGFGADHLGKAHHAAAAGLVDHLHRYAQALAHALCDQAGHHVHVVARWVGVDDLDGLAGPFVLRHGGQCSSSGQGGEGDQTDAVVHVSLLMVG